MASIQYASKVHRTSQPSSSVSASPTSASEPLQVLVVDGKEIRTTQGGALQLIAAARRQLERKQVPPAERQRIERELRIAEQNIKAGKPAMIVGVLVGGAVIGLIAGAGYLVGKLLDSAAKSSFAAGNAQEAEEIARTDAPPSTTDDTDEAAKEEPAATESEQGDDDEAE